MERFNKELKQGDVVYVRLVGLGREFGPSHVQKGVRPCVVISNNVGNAYSTIVTVVPCTSKNKKDLPTHSHFLIKKKRTGELVKNTALCEQIVTIDRSQITSKTGEVDRDVFKDIQKCVKVALNL